MKIFAIFGDPVAHSRSPLMHNTVFKALHVKAAYTRVHLTDGTKLRETFFKLGLSGANVTVPHKEAAFKACDEVRGFAKKIGVVNTLINEDGRLIGYNTDADGFMFAIRSFENIKNILLIGAGGTAKALANKFIDENFQVTVLNRSEGRLDYFKSLGLSCKTWERIETAPYDLIVNTTSAGLEEDSYPAPLEILKPLLQQSRYSADAIYGKVTPFLQLSQELGLTCKDGADMLLGQGVLANDYFTNHTLDKEKIERNMKESFLY
jgi:shikimate dehydrogenase